MEMTCTFMENLLRRIEIFGIPAHSPIEQRWTAASSSLMSPAHGKDDDLFSWVGIIMYLPSDDEAQRRAITDRFTGEYCNIVSDVGGAVNAKSHWAKLERPHTALQALHLRKFIDSNVSARQVQRYPSTVGSKQYSYWSAHDFGLGRAKGGVESTQVLRQGPWKFNIKLLVVQSMTS